MAMLPRASSSARLPCFIFLHASRLVHGKHGCEHGSVKADCRSLCDPLVRALVVCDQADYLKLCGRPERTFCDVPNVYGTCR